VRRIVAAAAVLFALSNAKAVPPTPQQLILHVRETAGVARNGEVVRSGVPLPRTLNVTAVDRLAVVDSKGVGVPSEFRILARWNAGLNVTSAPIQWLLIAFPATVAANATAAYRLVTDGSVVNSAPLSPLRLTLLYDTNKATLTAALARAAVQSGDPQLRAMAADLTARGIAASLVTGAPLGKEEGELLTRLHAAVANLSPATPPSRRRSIRH
jgi:hypothetical protein